MSRDSAHKKFIKLNSGKRIKTTQMPKSRTSKGQTSNYYTELEILSEQESESDYEIDERALREKYKRNEVTYAPTRRKSAILLDEELGMEILSSIKALQRHIEHLDKKLTATAKQVSLIKDKVEKLNHFKRLEESCDLLPKFPLKQADEFLTLEDNVKENEDMAHQLANFFLRNGGKDYSSFLRNNLKALLEDHAASAYSWTGQAGNIKVRNFYIIKLLKETCHATFSSTEDDMNTAIKVYFNRVKDRYKKTEQRKLQAGDC